MKTRMLFAFLLTICANALASDLCSSTDKRKGWSVECFDGKGEARQVKDIFLNRLRVDAYGKAVILIGTPRELLAVDDHGKIVIPNIRHAGDFDYPNAFRGIGRFSVSRTDSAGKLVEKCGYFQSPHFQVIAAPEFDECDAFREEGGYACKGCVSYCSDYDCHHRHFIGGQGFLLGMDGSIKKEFVMKTVETFCRRPDLVRIAELDHGDLMMFCNEPGDNPFVL